MALLPEDIADTIILVGDPDRVPMVSDCFDKVILRKQKREFYTHSGFLNGRHLTVISTGIGTDNIDIVLNELDALANIDLETRTLKPQHKTLRFIRIGTSGGLQPDIAVDSFIISARAIGLDALGHFYASSNQPLAEIFYNKILAKTGLSKPYSADADNGLLKLFSDLPFGITITAAGFYGPQGRTIRLKNKISGLFDEVVHFEHEGLKCTNMEMETAAIYLLSELLGHQSISCNAILANRPNNIFSSKSKETNKALIDLVLARLVAD